MHLVCTFTQGHILYVELSVNKIAVHFSIADCPFLGMSFSSVPSDDFDTVNDCSFILVFKCFSWS